MVEFGILEKNHGWIVFFIGAKSAENSLGNFQSGLIPQVQSCAFLSNVYRSVSADKKGGPVFLSEHEIDLNSI